MTGSAHNGHEPRQSIVMEFRAARFPLRANAEVGKPAAIATLARKKLNATSRCLILDCPNHNGTNQSALTILPL
jgi:hypothetical protein